MSTSGPAPENTPLTEKSERVRVVRGLARRAARDKSGLFLAEGPQCVRELLRWAPSSVDTVYAEVDASGSAYRTPALVTAALDVGVRVRPVTPAALSAMADTETPQGILAVARHPKQDLSFLTPERGRFFLVLHEVRDPGNAGTAIRAADAAGAAGVVLTANSVDLTNPKLVRSTVGSLWHLPVATGVPFGDLVERCRTAGISLLAADGHAATLLPRLAPDRRGSAHAWVMGNEAHGLSDDDRSACTQAVAIPLLGRAESLNLAMAATVLLYASATATYEDPNPLDG